MIQLPFHVNSILQGVVAGFLCGTVLLLLTILAATNVWWIRKPVDIFLAWKMSSIEEVKRFRKFEITMYVLSGIMIAIGAFYLLLFTGLVQNGEPPPLPTIEEFRRSMKER